METPLETAEKSGENTDAFCGWCGQEHGDCEMAVLRDLHGLASSHVERLHADGTFGTEFADNTLRKAAGFLGITA